MSQAPSYMDLKDSEYYWLQLTPYIAGMTETLDGSMNDELISSYLYYETYVSAIDDGNDFPFKELRIDVSERSKEEVESLSGKYPIGFLQFYEDGASITLRCRNDLVSRMISTLGLVKRNEIEFFITIPKLPSKLPSVYPILNYQYRVRSRSEAENA